MFVPIEPVSKEKDKTPGIYSYVSNVMYPYVYTPVLKLTTHMLNSKEEKNFSGFSYILNK